MRAVLLRRAHLAVLAFLSLPVVRGRLALRALEAWNGSGSVAFVCVGNICRSPFAEGLARTRAPGRTVLGAGTLQVEGRSSPEEAVTAAHGWQVDLRPHRSRTFSTELASGADAIYVFDLYNLIKVAIAHPRVVRRLHLLGALAADGPLLIRDPYGGDLEAFERNYSQIAAAIPGEERPPGIRRERRFRRSPERPTAVTA